MIKIETIKQDVEEGTIDALEAYIMLKTIEKELKESLDIVKEHALSEAEKYGEKTFDAFGAEVGVKNGAGRWDFKKLAWWKAYQLEQESAKEAFKMSEKGQKLIN